MTLPPTLITVLEQAEQFIESGHLYRARQLITTLPEALYNLALDNYNNHKGSYQYYLLRYVLDSFDAASEATFKGGMKRDIYRFGMMLDITREQLYPETVRDGLKRIPAKVVVGKSVGNPRKRKKVTKPGKVKKRVLPLPVIAPLGRHFRLSK